MSGVTVHGPYPHRNRWRLVIKERGRTLTCPSYPTRKEAEEAKTGHAEITRVDNLWAEAARLEEKAANARERAQAAVAGPTTIRELIDRYVLYLRDHKKRRPTTVQTTSHQLRGLLGPVMDLPAQALTARRAGALYQARAAQVAAATHHGNLRQTRSLWRWAAKQRLVRPGLWDDVEPIGQPAEGKEQLHPSAAERLFTYALAQAVAPPPADRRRRNRPRGAAAVLCSLIMGMRSTEIVSLSPWDVDEGLLRVKRGKSRHARRWMRIPPDVWDALAPHVADARAQGQPRVFPFHRSWVRDQVKRLCREIKVPEVCAHALRGTHATVAIEAGATAEAVARQLGHGGTAVTRRHYIDPAAAIEVAAARVLAELSGRSDSAEPSGSELGALRPAALEHEQDQAEQQRYA